MIKAGIPLWREEREKERERERRERDGRRIEGGGQREKFTKSGCS